MTWKPASEQDGTYPRPQLVRTQWCSLDRPVAFAFDDDDTGRTQHWESDARPFSSTIELPFAPEAPASGIGDTAAHPVVWYRIVLGAVDLASAGHSRPSAEPGVDDALPRRLLIHFGAVDWAADVWCNGQHITRHEGGQTAFAVDVTDALETTVEDSTEQVVVVRAEDRPYDPALPRGKQDWRAEPHAIWYERTTGIWRSVWLESVPGSRVAELSWQTDTRAGCVQADVTLGGQVPPQARVRVELTYNGEPVGAAEVETADDQGGAEVTHGARRPVTVVVPVPRLRNGQAGQELLWSPSHPALVDARVSLLSGRLGATGGPDQVLDAVTSYLGIRSVGVREGRFTLNDRPLLVRGVLEQGYWPDSHYTAPSVAALRAEVELVKSLGFNTARLHQKVEDPRLVYWADRLGLLLWAEAPAAYAFSHDAVGLTTRAWLDTVQHYRSHPSVVVWVPFNESWGIQEVGSDTAQQAFCAGLTALTRALDPTRPVVSNDGWEHVDSDLLTVHDYESDGAVMARRYRDSSAIAELVAGPGPAGRRLLASGARPHDEAPVMVSEFGGVSFTPAAAPAGSWGYSTATTASEFADRIADLFTAVTGATGLAGFCWTQLTDTRQETNGLCDARRVPKLPAAMIAGLVAGATRGER